MTHFKHWLRHTAGVPKGLLRYWVIELLAVRPMSGSEIMEEAEERTGWRPSPGSVYPLLAWLRDKGFVEKVSAEDEDVKRFRLTDKGKALKEEHRRRREFYRKKFHSMRRIWLGLAHEKDELLETNLRLIDTVEEVRLYLKGEDDRWALEEVKKILVQATGQIEGIKRKLTER